MLKYHHLMMFSYFRSTSSSQEIEVKMLEIYKNPVGVHKFNYFLYQLEKVDYSLHSGVNRLAHQTYECGYLATALLTATHL